MESDNTINSSSVAQPANSCVTDDWRKAMLSVETVYNDAPVVLRVNGVRAGTLGNFSASIGKAKSKKSFNVTAMAAAALCSDYVLGYDVILPQDNAISALIPFLRDKGMLIQDKDKQGNPYRYDPTSKW